MIRKSLISGKCVKDPSNLLITAVRHFHLQVEAGSKEPARREIILSVVCEGTPDPLQLSDAMKRYEEMEEEKLGRKKYGKKRGKIKNVVIRRAFGKYMVETTHLFSTLDQLIQYYKQNPGNLFKTVFILQHPVRQQSWEYYHSDVRQGSLLGEGAFGIVREGTLRTKSGKVVPVAVKQTKADLDLCKAKIKEMMKEARLMRHFRHKNIVRTYGVAVDEQPLLLILELVTGWRGSLNNFLRQNGERIDVTEKIIMCLGAASGVEYLHLNQCMHRDLAARNCLITREKVVKISDFGLSRMGTHYVLKSAIKLPIRWLAPETIATFAFSLKSDVFSFGVLAYEIFANGAEPWDRHTNAEVKAAVLGGMHLKFPAYCPARLREFFSSRVFAKTPSHRPSMTEVVKMLKSFSTADEYADLKRRHSPTSRNY
ncbi:protein tyrosine kinase [Necator americanus]|uniref:Protein tyrosine kinase n=1 Tax=Necator americanus TaxID=51031 RepID=W2TRP2_NECAM|nr:protein tyrosine kinase [Necator americanus]ETN84730.1 protein tyrosine kinase [Necator americanus]